MNTLCISKSWLRQKSQELGIKDSAIESIVHEYINQQGNNNFPTDDYIKQQFIPKSQLVDDEDYFNNLIKIYNNIGGETIYNTEEEAIVAQNKALKVFDENSVTLMPTNDGKYIVRIAEPINKNYEKELQDILAKAPRDSQGRLLAPNGKPSNLTERQYAQVRTKEFKKWFGDWEKEYTPPIQYDLSTWERTGEYVDVLEKDFLGNTYSASKEILSHPVERKEPTKEDPFGFNSAGVSKAIKIGTLVNRSNPLNGICQFTAQRIQAFLKDRYGINTYINIISAKSPVTGKLITHYVVVLSIDGKPYIYDMPQTEFITTNGNTFNVGNKEYKEAVITKEYTPRLIPITKESLLKNYGDSNDIQISVIENMAKLSDNIKSSDIETSYIPAYSPDVSKLVDENGEPLVVYHTRDSYNIGDVSTGNVYAAYNANQTSPETTTPTETKEVEVKEVTVADNNEPTVDLNTGLNIGKVRDRRKQNKNNENSNNKVNPRPTRLIPSRLTWGVWEGFTNKEGKLIDVQLSIKELSKFYTEEEWNQFSDEVMENELICKGIYYY